MALAERDLNLVRRNSKSSTYTASLKDDPSPSIRGQRSLDVLPSGSAVLSMLKTTTETGDIGTFSVAQSRLPRLPKALNRRPHQLGHSSSRASSHYSRSGSRQGSIRSAKSHRSGQDTSSDAGLPYIHRRYARSQDFPLPSSDAASFTARDNGRTLTMTTTGRFDPTDRSYSLTQEPSLARQLADNRSVTSLRSQGWTGRPRSPFVQGPRFPGNNRPASPALSDTAGAFLPRRPQTRNQPYPRPSPAPLYPSRFSPDIPPAQFSPAPRSNLASNAPLDDYRRPFVSNTFSEYDNSMEAPSVFRRPQLPSRPMHQLDHGPLQRPVHGFPPRAPLAPDPLANQQIRRAQPPDLAPYAGFVQRVKNVLEERMSPEDVCSSHSRLVGRKPFASPAGKAASVTANAIDTTASVSEQDELPRPNQTESSYAEEIQQGSPSVKRLTRDLIKAGMDGMSDIAETSDVGITTPRDQGTEFELPDDGSGDIALWKTQETQGIPGSFPEDPVSAGDAAASNRLPAEQLGAGVHEESPPRKHDSTTFNLRLSILKNGDHNSGQGLGYAQGDGRDPGIDCNDMPSHVYSGDVTRPISMPYQPGRIDDRTERDIVAKSMPPISLSDMSKVPELSIDDDVKTNQSSEAKSTPTTIVTNIRENCEEFDTEYNSRRPTSEDRNGELNALAVGSTLMPAGPACQPGSLGDAQRTVAPVPPSRLLGRHLSSGDGLRIIPSASRSGALTSDQRTSAIRNFHAPLPDLTEDSQEDASTTNLRMLGMRAPMFRPRHVRELRPPSRLSSETTGIPDQTARGYLNMTFADTRNIPSFQFSKVDLTTKLNRALGYRFSRSFEDFTQSTVRSAGESTEDRPASSTMARERYASFFMFEECRQDDHEPQGESEGEGEGEGDATVEETEITKSISASQEILNEIDKLSIPSVKHLTARLSELLPNIKQSQSECDLDNVDKALKDTIQELRALGAPEQAQSINSMEKDLAAFSRRGTVTSKASGANSSKRRDRPLIHLMKDLPPLPASGKDQKDGGATDEEATAEDAARASRDSTRAWEEEGTAVDNTVSTIIQDLAKATAESGESKKASASDEARAAEGTPRPWNNKDSYPWTNATPPIKLTSADEAEEEGATGPSSAPDPTEDGEMHAVRSMSPGFDANLVPLVMEDKASVKSGKRGLMKSLSQMVGLKAKADKVGGAQIDPHFLHPEEHSQTLSDRRVGQGDRYPTTSLIAPDDVQIEGLPNENQSFFSNNSSISDQGMLGFRKRLTRFVPRHSNGSPDNGSPTRSRNGSRSELARPMRRERAVNPAPALAFQQHSQEAAPPGMSKAEFRAKKLVEKLRFLLYKSGERLRSLASPRKRPAWYESDESMLYHHA